MYPVTKEWLGGTLSNFLRITVVRDLEEKAFRDNTLRNTS
jgi:ribosomal protein S2